MYLRARIGEWRRNAAPLLNLLLFGFAVFVIDKVMREYHPREVAAALGRIPVSGIIASLASTALGYLALVGYDFIALRFIGRPMRLRTVFVPSLISFAISNSTPVSAFAAGGLRYKLYKPLGLSGEDAAVIAGFNIITYVLGLFTLAGVLLLISPMRSFAGRLSGVTMLCVAAAYFVTAAVRPGLLRIGRLRVRVPRLQLAFEQLAVSLADWILSSGALYVLLTTLAPLSYIEFTTAFVVAQFTTLLLPVPGGIGVFEAVMLLLRPSGVPASYTLAALLLYRVIYYVLPLMAAGALLGVRWLADVRRSADPVARLQDQIGLFASRVIAWTTFLAGMLLLISGVVPTSDRRLAWLGQVLPLGIIEATHLLGSIIGALLIVLAWGIELRSRTAYRTVRVLFGTGIALSAVRSLNYTVAIALTAGLIVLVTAGRYFPRASATTRAPITGGWLFAIGAVLIGLGWIAVLLYRHANLGGEVWWRFALFGNAPRALRASVAAATLILIVGAGRLVAGRRVSRSRAGGVRTRRR